MFPEFRDLIKTLKEDNNHFASLYQKHSDLDAEIEKITNSKVSLINTPTPELTQLKRDKLKLKEEIYAFLKDASLKSAS